MVKIRAMRSKRQYRSILPSILKGTCTQSLKEHIRPARAYCGLGMCRIHLKDRIYWHGVLCMHSVLSCGLFSLTFDSIYTEHSLSYLAALFRAELGKFLGGGKRRGGKGHLNFLHFLGLSAGLPGFTPGQ
jgi:hypothetical protein